MEIIYFVAGGFYLLTTVFFTMLALRMYGRTRAIVVAVAMITMIVAGYFLPNNGLKLLASCGLFALIAWSLYWPQRKES